MATVSEANYAGEFIIGELNTLSKDNGVLISGQNVLAGTVLGRIETAAATAAIVGTGNGSIGTITVGAGAQTGIYVLEILTAGTNVFTYNVKDPQLDVIGTGENAVAFVGGGLSFTLADGATDFTAGTKINITVAAGSLKYTLHDNAATNGSQIAAAIAYADYDATDGDIPIVVITRNQEVNYNKLVWKSGISAGNKTLSIAQLAANHIIVREVA